MILDRKRILFTILFFLVLLFLYRYSPRRIEFLGYYDKVFAHRVNSLDKLNAALNYFDGVELDLVYDKTNNSFDVNHPPAKSIGLTLERYLAEIPENQFPFLWLDIKTLDATNDSLILKKLNVLFENTKYPKKQILIESLQPEGLPLFTKAGYRTSYYLPVGLVTKPPAELNILIEDIKKKLLEQPEIGISTSYENYPVLSKFFPEKEKYIWALSSSYRPKYKAVRTLLEDETVLVVLSSFQSLSGNR